MPRLVYETTDTRFADRAIDALREADVPCYRVGTGLGDGSPVTQLQALGESRICIYLERESDYPKASDILVRLGAAKEEPLPIKWVFRLSVLLVIAIAICVALMWSQ